MKYFKWIRLGGKTPKEEDLGRILPRPWQIVPRCGAGTAQEDVLIAVPISVTTPREELVRSLSEALGELRSRLSPG
jgi:hypothetical protein